MWIAINRDAPNKMREKLIKNDLISFTAITELDKYLEPFRKNYTNSCWFKIKGLEKKACWTK
jgi:hypothetical protein